MLEQYNNIIPNGADRIMKMAENQIVHRHQLETKVVDNNITAARVGQWLAFIIGMTTIVGGFYLISIDKDVYGVATLITAVVALVSVFIYGRKKQQEERAQKMQLLPEKLKA